MPLTKSAKKAWRSSERKRQRNQKQKVELEKALKNLSRRAKAEVSASINEVISKIDKAAKTHLISKNKAARLKSRLMKKFGTPKNVKTKSANVKATTKSKKEIPKKSPKKK